MSKHHHYNYSAITNKKPVDAPTNIDDVNDVEVENENDNNNVNVENENVNIDDATDNTPTPEIAPEPVVGHVSDCMRLNVRKEPESTATVVGILNVDDEVKIDIDNSTDSFYKISSSKAEGYCMKQFITIE